MTAIDLDALRRGLSRDSMDDSMGSRSYQSSAIYEAARAYLAAVASDDEITAAAGSDVAFDRPGQELSQLGRADRDRYLQRARAAITAAKIKRHRATGMALGLKCEACAPCHADVLLKLANASEDEGSVMIEPDRIECGECNGEGGHAYCHEDCCPIIGGEDECRDPACWQKCRGCGGTGWLISDPND